MFRRTTRQLVPILDRGPLRVMFVITSMPVGGAETLLANLIRHLDRDRFLPELCCLKQLGPLGEGLAREVPATSDLTSGKYDLRVWHRLTRLMRTRRIDAVVTVGAGDKMFWGRLAAWRAGVPVVLSALHSTGWPDNVGRLNRLLTPLTDAFVGVASAHGRHLIERERFPAAKVRVIPNGVDTERFRPLPREAALCRDLAIQADTPVVAIVAALRPEKNHELLLRAMKLVTHQLPDARLLVIGDGPRREGLVALADDLRLSSAVHFVGTRSDVPELLSLANVLALSSHNEANPVSILEAMACGKPVVATRVGSVAESVRDGQTGFLTEPGDGPQFAGNLLRLLADPVLAQSMGRAGREAVVANWSLERMVAGYQDLIGEIYAGKCGPSSRGARQGLCPAPTAR